MNCPWCGAAVEAGKTACSRCGVVLDARNEKMHSGWAKLPGRKDMAKLQFGNSTCQIEGAYVPVADLKLAPEDWITFAHHVLLWKDPAVAITGVKQDGPWKALAGPTRVLMEARGPGHIAISEDNPGELVTLPLEPGQRIHVRQHAQSWKQEQSTDPQKHLFLAATGNVTYTWFGPDVWFHSGQEGEHHYPVGRHMDVFGAKDKPGLLLLHAAGNVFVRQLADGQHILVKPAALVFKDSTVKMDLYYDSPKNAQLLANNAGSSRGIGYIWLRLHGPGRVAIQSVFERVEGEEEFSKSHNRHSAMYPPELPPPVVPIDPTQIPTGKTPLKIGVAFLMIALLVFLVRRATLPAGAGINDYGGFVPLILGLGVFGLMSLLLAFILWKSNAQIRSKKAKP